MKNEAAYCNRHIRYEQNGDKWDVYYDYIEDYFQDGPKQFLWATRFVGVITDERKQRIDRAKKD
jgi:hypothetical protein